MELELVCAFSAIIRTIGIHGPHKQYGKGNVSMDEEASYVCDSCGEEIVIPIDVSAGSDQTYVEDCPVCCRSNVIHVEFDEGGTSRAWGEREF